MDRKKEAKLKRALVWIINILENKDIPYVITGGFAAHLYGATRPINDIDLDVPSAGFAKIMPEVKRYITESHENYRNPAWDLKFMTLNYKGQEIDICAADSIKIFDEASGKYESFPTDLSTGRKIEFFGLELNIVDPVHLVTYKKLLGREHQERDIREVVSNLKLDI